MSQCRSDNHHDNSVISNPVSNVIIQYKIVLMSLAK